MENDNVAEEIRRKSTQVRRVADGATCWSSNNKKDGQEKNNKKRGTLLFLFFNMFLSYVCMCCCCLFASARCHFLFNLCDVGNGQERNLNISETLSLISKRFKLKWKIKNDTTTDLAAHNQQGCIVCVRGGGAGAGGRPKQPIAAITHHPKPKSDARRS